MLRSNKCSIWWQIFLPKVSRFSKKKSKIYIYDHTNDNVKDDSETFLKGG